MSNIIVIQNNDEPALRSDFLVALREYCADLVCKWDQVSEKFMVYDTSKGFDDHILTIEGEKGEYVDPGTWVIDAMKQLDFTAGAQRYRNTRFYFRRIRERNREWERKLKENKHDEHKDFVMREILPPTKMIIKTMEI